LIFNTKTRKFTLERLESNFSLKRNRIVSSSKPINSQLPRCIKPKCDKNAAKKQKLDNIEQPVIKKENKQSTTDQSLPRSSFLRSNSSEKLSKMVATPPVVKEKDSIQQQAVSKSFPFVDDLNLSESDSDNTEL
jgi:hypothetical protein